MPDICDLILDDHELFRRRFAELDDERRSGPSVVGDLWQVLALALERHASAEEAVFYPALLEQVSETEGETHHAIRDHNKIRDAVRRVAEAEVGGDEWWQAVSDANEENSDHMSEEERGPLSGFRRNGDREVRRDLGGRFVAFNTTHADGTRLSGDDTDPDEFLEEHAAT
jgi:Hemerythrin HHE cation binding domain